MVGREMIDLISNDLGHFQSDLKRVQFLHCKLLCFFPHCNLKAARKPVKALSGLNSHYRNYHDTPEENEYKRQFIGKLSYKTTDGRTKLVCHTINGQKVNGGSMIKDYEGLIEG
jgi:hypothetical protein